MLHIKIKNTNFFLNRQNWKMKLWAVVTDLRAFIQLCLVNSSDAMLLLPSCLLWSFCNRSSPFSRTDRRKCMPMHNLFQYRNCTLFKPTFVGDFRLAVSLCDSTAEARAKVSSCQSHTGDSNGSTRRLSNLAQAKLSVSWAHQESLVLLEVFFLLLHGKRSWGTALQGWGVKG